MKKIAILTLAAALTAPLAACDYGDHKAEGKAAKPATVTSLKAKPAKPAKAAKPVAEAKAKSQKS